MDKNQKELYIKQYGKKAYQEFCKRNRVLTGMNTGTRVMKTEKTYSRKEKHKGAWKRDSEVPFYFNFLH